MDQCDTYMYYSLFLMRGARKGNIKNNTIFWKNGSRKTELIFAWAYLVPMIIPNLILLFLQNIELTKMGTRVCNNTLNMTVIYNIHAYC